MFRCGATKASTKRSCQLHTPSPCSTSWAFRLCSGPSCTSSANTLELLKQLISVSCTTDTNDSSGTGNSSSWLARSLLSSAQCSFLPWSQPYRCCLQWTSSSLRRACRYTGSRTTTTTSTPSRTSASSGLQRPSTSRYSSESSSSQTCRPSSASCSSWASSSPTSPCSCSSCTRACVSSTTSRRSWRTTPTPRSCGGRGSRCSNSSASSTAWASSSSASPSRRPTPLPSTATRESRSLAATTTWRRSSSRWRTASLHITRPTCPT
mmetsp:Transcript_27137/g.62563  ORF Transcript_27137/g.62563 Transcript_27137/m.62563 type:complete len:265 (-) Transcript_27137:353-1147(-)